MKKGRIAGFHSAFLPLLIVDYFLSSFLLFFDELSLSVFLRSLLVTVSFVVVCFCTLTDSPDDFEAGLATFCLSEGED